MATTATASPTTYSDKDITAAIKAVYGLDPSAESKLPAGSSKYLGQQTVQTPDGGTMPIAQLMYMYNQGQAAQSAQAALTAQAAQAASGTAGGPSGAGGQSYLGTAGATPQSFQSTAPQSYPGTAGASTSMANGSPTIQSGSGSLYLPNGTAISPADTQKVMSMYDAYKSGDMVSGKTLAQWMQGAGLTQSSLDTAVNNMQQGTGPNAGPAPETTALGQMAGIDPQSEALRQQLAGSYADPSKAATPTASQYQSYLNTFKQVDPEEYAQRQGLATSMDSYLKQAQDQAALGSQLDPVTARQVEQQTRLGQVARGNVYGTPQMVEEAMTTGQAGLALQQQRQQQLGTALGAQQSYLGAGLGLGDTAMGLYQQGLGNKNAAQQAALSYLSSGQTPYQAGSAYVNQANQNAAMAAQGGPQYNPSALGQSSQAAQIPQYGLDIGQQAQNWYNSFSAYGGGGAPTKNKGAAAMSGAATGALSGAVGGATLGSVVPGVGTLIGAGVGAVAGGALGAAGGYYS